MRAFRLTSAALVLLALAGCSRWLGEPEDAPLPGERVPVMLLDERLTADPEIADLEVVLPSPIENDFWPQPYGGPTHSPGHLALADNLTLAWRTDIGRGTRRNSRLLGQPVGAEGKVFAVDASGTISAVAADDGGIVWRTPLEGLGDSDRLRAGGIVYGDGRLYVTTAAGGVVSLDAETGRELWRKSLLAPIRVAPTFIEGRLLVLTSSNQLFALDAATGDLIWQHAGLFEQAAILGAAAPAAVSELAIVAYSSGEVFALDLREGQPFWSDTVLRPRRTLAIGNISDITGSPVIDSGRVIVAGNGGETASLDLRTGARLWDVDITSPHTPWVAGDFLYLLTDRNEVVALVRRNGLIRWVSPLGRLRNPDNPDSQRVFWAGPVLAGDRLLFAGSTGEAVSVSPYTGEILGRIDLGAPVSLPPIVFNETLVFLTDDGTLLAYR